MDIWVALDDILTAIAQLIAEGWLLVSREISWRNLSYDYWIPAFLLLGTLGYIGYLQFRHKQALRLSRVIARAERDKEIVDNISAGSRDALGYPATWRLIVFVVLVVIITVIYLK
jgi:hypothetical protein